MTDFPDDIDLHTDYEDAAPAAQERVPAATLDADHLELERWLNDVLLPALACIMRDDCTLTDYLVRYRNLHPEVLTELAEAVGSVPLAVPADGSVTTAKLALLAVTTAMINDLAVTTGKIDALAVTTAKIALLNITTALIADLAVTTGKLADLAVTDAKVATAAAIAWTKINKTGAVPGDVGAAAASHAHSAADITSGTMAAARLGSGGGGAGAKFLADDQTFKTPSISAWETADIRVYAKLGAVPTGFLECDGAAIDRTTYADLFAALCPADTVDQSTGVNITTETLTTDADTVCETGTPIRVSSSGSLPTGLSAGTLYYAIKTGATTIKVASSLANARAGTDINLTGAGSGTMTIRAYPFGQGDGSTTFNVPNLQHRKLIGAGGTGDTLLATCLGASNGPSTGYETSPGNGITPGSLVLRFIIKT